MASGRLSRNELGWLLAQEARGAAKALRQNVTLLTQPPPRMDDRPEAAAGEQLETTLNALDDAITLISELETGSPTGRGRRGRIDLAALLYEVAPHARIAIEPGAGTEVFGEEAELRRLLHVLVSQSNGPAGSQEAAAAEVRIRREGDWVRISVDLGPDVSASVELERRWLSRMAIRLGGRLELDSGAESVLLPADASVDQSEVADLKKELQQAQELGEAYARELASVFETTTDATHDLVPRDATEVAARRFDQLVSTASAMLRLLAPTVEQMKEDAALASSSSGGSALRDRLLQRASSLAELLGELSRVATCPADESLSEVNLTEISREAVQGAETRGARHGVQIGASLEAPVHISSRREPLSLLVRSLLDHAIAATPKDEQVSVAVVQTEGTVELTVVDGGPRVPAASVNALLENRLNPASLGRPVGLGLLVAETVSAYLGATITLGNEEDGRTSVTASWSRTN